MKCPICETQAKVIDKREVDYMINYRTLECPECLTRFKTSEKVIFTSLPLYIRQKFLETGERK
jgi:transcriptional regulator NrdR family protein